MIETTGDAQRDRFSRMVIPADLAELSRARRFVKELGLAAQLSEARSFDLQVATSEAVANAIEHAASEVGIEAWLLVDRVIVEVSNDGAFRPGLYKDDDHRRRGLGLPLMVSLADQVHVSRRPENKTRVLLTFFLGVGNDSERPGSSISPDSAIRQLEAESMKLGLMTTRAQALDDERVLAHEEMRQRVEELERVMDTVPVAIWVARDRECLEITGNPMANEFYEARADENVSAGPVPGTQDTTRRFFQDGRELMPDELPMQEAAARGANIRNSELEVLLPSGAHMTMLGHASPLRDAQGQVRGCVGAFVDITERKRAEKALRESEQTARRAQERYRTLFNTLIEGFCVIEVVFDEGDNPIDYRFLETNPRFEEQTGLHDVQGKLMRELAPDNDEHWYEFYGKVALTGEPARCQAPSTPLGRFYDVSAFRVGGPESRQVGILFNDITPRKRAEEAVYESESFYRQTLESIPGMVFTTRPDGYCDYQSQQWVDYTGVPMSEHLGSGWNELLHPQDRAQALAAWERAVKGEAPYDLEYRVRRQDGAYEWFKVIGRPILNDSGEIVRWFGTALNIEDLKRTDDRLRESEERHRALAEENERLYRQQLEIAESLQGSLLNIPSDLGRVRLGHLYRSATEAAYIGGDFYDAFEVKGGKIAVLIGDVAGHGIEAARVAVLTKDVTHAFIHQTLQPEQVLRRTSDLLLEKSFKGFVTVFLGILDPETGTFTYSSAGHPDALVRRSSGEVQVLGGGSPPLGVFPEASWNVAQIQLEANDLLLLYTDGIIEARRKGDFFGEKRLKALLGRERVAVERLPQLILDEVLAFSGQALRDDVAILALSFAGGGD